MENRVKSRKYFFTAASKFQKSFEIKLLRWSLYLEHYQLKTLLKIDSLLFSEILIQMNN